MVAAPRVSVVIPVFNGEEVIADAVGSMLTQSVQDIEVIVVDDASTDRTVQVMRSTFTDDRLCLVEHGRNLGAALARNTGLERARGEYIAFLDADDISLPNRLEAQIRYLVANPRIGAVGSSVELFGETTGAIDLLCSPEEVAASTMFSCEFLMPAMMFRRGALDALGMLFRPQYSANCDWELVARLVRSTGVANLPERLVKYRRWPSQMTARIVDTVDCPATLLRSEMLEWFGIPVKEQDLAAHIVAAPCYWPMEVQLDKPVTKTRVLQWLYKVLRRNGRTRRFDEDALATIVCRVAANIK